MKVLNRFCAIALLTIAVTACSSKASLELADSQSDPAYTQKPAESIAVLAWYKDDQFETRALIENAFTAAWRGSGIDAQPGYRFFDRYEGLTEQVEATAAKLVDAGVDTVVFIDPVRAKDYDPGEYTARRSAYRALGLDSSATINLINQIAAEADAAKYVMEVTVWSPSSKSFGWAGTYNINAPNGYDSEYAKQYSADFANEVAEDLRAAGILK